MDELIRKQDAINVIMGQPPEPHYPSWYAEQIKLLPPVPQRTGHWIPMTYRYVPSEKPPYTVIKWIEATEPDDIEGLKCSECGEIYDFTEARNWCSECGARMVCA